MDLSTFASSTPLHIGDFIVLRLSKPDEGWLSSEGLLDDECFVTPETEDFHNCIWEIHVQNQYSATREYKEALAHALALNESNKDSQNSKAVTKGGTAPKKTFSQEYLAQLHRAALNEQRLNDKLMNLKLGKPINYGDPIQLRHVKSRKFLTISSNILAREERENMKILVDSDGDSLSCVGFMPRYRYEREGQLLTNNSEVVVRVHERPGEYLHAAKNSSSGVRNEVNCSLENSFWTLILYQRVVDVGLNSIMAGQLVTLQDPDSLSCITLDDQAPGITERANIVMSPQFQARDLSADATVGTHLLWLVEKANVIGGGPIAINSDPVTFRDLNTGLYMKIESEGLVAVKQRSAASIFEFHNSQNASSFDSPYLEAEAAVNLSSDNFWIGNITKVENVSKHGARCTGFTDKSLAVSLSVSAALFQKIGVNLHVGVQATMKLRRLLRVTDQYEHGLSLIRELAQEVKNCNSVLESLCSFLALTDTASKDESNSLLDGHNKEVITVRQNMVREQGLIDVLLDLLSMTETNIYDKIKEPIVKRESARNSARKIQRKNSVNLVAKESLNNSREDSAVVVPHGNTSTAPQRRSSFGAIFGGGKGSPGSKNNEIEMAIKSVASSESTKPKNLQELIASKKSQHHDINAPDSDDSEEDEEEDEEDKEEINQTNDAHLTVSQLIAQKCLKVLLCIIVENFTNQLYVADRFPVLLAEVRDHRLAVLCVEEMLRENLTILQTKVRQREIDIFVSLLAQSEMSVTFLRLLQSTTSCPMGVDATQRMVANALFGNSSNDNPRSRATSDHVTTETDLIPAPRFNNSDSMKARHAGLESANQRLIIQIMIDKSKKSPANWGDFSLYCPVNPRKVVKGFEELADGLPDIWLSWKMKGKNGDFSMHQLFGYREKVPLAVICSASRKSLFNKSKPNSAVESISARALRRKATIYKKKGTTHAGGMKLKQNQTIVTIANYKSQVAEYFKTQLYLVADLCLDRNYVSIGMLEPLYEYETMIAMLKHDAIPSSFKAPVCRVLRCLYVDRDPQTASKFPRYIRTSVSLNTDKSEEVDIEHNEEQDSKQYKFALIQKLLSDYVHNDLDLSCCDELSAESIELLQALVKFGFYEKVPQILDILQPLLKVLDKHQKRTSDEKDSDESIITSSSNLIESKSNRFSLKRWISNRGSKYQQISPDVDEEMFDIQSEKKNIPWHKVWIERTDSLVWMISVFTVVILSVVMMIVQLFSEIDLSGFYVVTTLFFGMEYFFRFFVNSFGEKGVRDFCFDPFNLLDAGLVLLDVVMLSLGADGSQASASRATRSLRIIRIIRVARLIRAARLLRQIAAASNAQQQWEVPQRFRNIKRYEAKTIVNILKVFTMFYDRIQDNTLELGIQAFSHWCKAIKNKYSCDPVDTFHKALASEERLSSELSFKFDAVLLDTMMYSDKSITHAALHLLMVHKSQKDLFFKVFEKIQIIYSPRIENICKQLTDMLRELKGLAEMFEIWSDLESEDDVKSANRVQDILNCIRGYLIKRNEDRSLGIRSLTLVDEEVQNLLRNLDAMTTFMALEESLYDGGREELKPRIREILKSCNSLICLFVKTSEANQTVAFKYLSWFVDRADDDIDSTRVARTIVEGNKCKLFQDVSVQLDLFICLLALIKQCSRRYLSEFAHKIVSQGHKPEYLDLFVGMTELSEVMGSHVLVVENEISTYLTGREWKKHILLWCCTADSNEYKERKVAMEAVKAQNQLLIGDEQLTPDLRYHISILILLASCNLGPKLHAIYPVQDILIAIMDSATIFPVKKALGLLLIEVLKSSSDRVEKLDTFWLLLDQIALEMETLPSEMFTLARNHPMRIQKGEWLEISSGIITTFFQDFDLAHFLDHHPDKSNNNGGTTKNQPDVKITIERLHSALRLLIDQNAQKIGGAVTEELIFSATVLHNLLDPDGQDIDAMENNDIKLKASRMQHQRTSVVYADLQQVYYRKQFKIFLRHIKESTSTSRVEVINVFKSIPKIDDQVDSDVRFEPLIKKLTTHFRSSIKRSPLSRSIQEGAVETCAWFLKAMRHLFEDALGLTFEKLDEVDVGTLVEPEEVEKLRLIFNDQGITYLCLDLIAVGVEHSLYIEAIKLLVVMLLKSGGCQEIQKSIYLYLFETDSILFFELIKDMIESLKAWSNKEAESPSGSSIANQQHANVPEDVIVLNLLQGICEGSYMGNRDQIREQTGNSKIVNILESLATLVGFLSRMDSAVHSKITIKVLKTVLRLVQGPCKGNQEQFVLHTELLISLNRMIRGARPNVHNASSAANQNFEHLKEAIIDTLRGVIEGQSKTSLSFDRVTTTIDFSVLQVLVIPPDQEILETILGPQGLTSAQAKFFVLTETMKKSNHGVNGNSAISTENVSDEPDNDISSVEVQWNNNIQVVYFPVPQFVKDLSTESKNKLLETDQDFASRELKLMDFVHKIKTLHRESTHQQFLKRYGMSDLWTFKYYLTRLMFANAIVMNCIIISFYGTTYKTHSYYGGGTHPIYHGSTDDHHATDDHSTDDHHRMLAGSSTGSATTGIHDHLYAPHHIQVVLNWLNIIQFAFAIITVGIFCIVQVPVTFATEFEKHKTYLSSIFYTMLDPLPIWYFAYLVFTFLGMELHHFFLSALLLDWIVLDSTTQDLLLAVQYPARQLVATLVIILIMQNIFAGLMFVLYRHDVVTVPIRDMWDALKLCISYGFRGEYGIDHEMEPTLGVRMVLDITFYFIILSILRHIFFAIIVDTFGKLRELKFERESEAKNTCFVCGIERHDYDRIVPVGTTQGFAHHRNIVHNPLNYMAFIMNIWNQSQSEDSSLEIYVRECLKKGDVGWFPAGVHYEAHVAVAEAIDDHAHGNNAGHSGHGGGHGGHGGHGHGKKKHGHGHTAHTPAHKEAGGHGDAKGHDDVGHAQAHTTPANRRVSNFGIRPRSAIKEKESTAANSDVLLEKMQLMQQQLMTISKNITNGPAEPATPIRYSIIDTSYTEEGTGTGTGRYRTTSSGFAVPSEPVATRIESDPALVEAIANMNAAMVKMMGRIDEMEKKLSKSHKYLRHRIRMNNSNAKPLPHPLANSPFKMLMNKKQTELETPGKSLNQDPSPQNSNGQSDIDELLPRPSRPQSASASQKAKSRSLLPDGNDADEEDLPKLGGQKLENSDSESSLTSSRCTENEDDDQEVMGKQTLKKPMPSQSPVRPTSAGVVRSTPAVPQHQRPQSANPKTSSNGKAMSGPPKSMISNLLN